MKQYTTLLPASLLVLLLCSLAQLASAQVIVDPDLRIFPTPNIQAEVHVSVNKTNPANVLVSANTWSTAASYNQSYYYSIDGGITWNGSDQLPTGGVGGGDPATDFDASGRGYLATLTTAIDGYSVQHTDDRGTTWSAQVRGAGPTPGGDFDKEMVVTIDEMQTSPFVNNFYCAWTDFSDAPGKVKVNRSTNGTGAFSAPITLSQTFGHGTNVQTGPNGEVYVAWADYTNGSLPAQNLGFAVSLDGGVTYASSRPFAYAGIRTSNAGNPLFGNTRINDFPVIAVDKSCGPFRGRIYVVYPIFSPGTTKSIIQCRFSDNHGTTWSNAQTISIPGGFQNWFPWVAVDDQTGLVNVAYYSMDVAANSTATNTHVAYSLDGGATWADAKASSTPHTTGPINNTIFASGYAGDYIGIASFGGQSWVAWGDNRNANWQVYMARLHYNIPTLSASQTNLSINAPASITGNRQFQAFHEITVSNTTPVDISSTAQVALTAGTDIILDPGFATDAGAFVTASIAAVPSCTTPGAVFYQSASVDNWHVPAGSNEVYRSTDASGLNLFAYPNPVTDLITIGCMNKGYTKVLLEVFDRSGRRLAALEPTSLDASQARFIYDASALLPGVYIYHLITDGKTHTGKFLKVKK